MNKLLAIVLFVLSSAVFANEPVGRVKTATGEAFITTSGKKDKAEVGSPVYQGSLIETGKNSSLGITFKDETMVSFGANTVFTVSDYVYEPSDGKLKFGSKLAKGSLNYVSGAIGKLKPEAVTVGTPSGTIGVRGTQFLVTVAE
jgi:hypothetical protein